MLRGMFEHNASYRTENHPSEPRNMLYLKNAVKGVNGASFDARTPIRFANIL